MKITYFVVVDIKTLQNVIFFPRDDLGVQWLISSTVTKDIGVRFPAETVFYFFIFP